MLKCWGFREDEGGTSDFRQGNDIVRYGIWEDFTGEAMWRLDWRQAGDQLDLCDCGGPGETREAWSEAEAMRMERRGREK